MSGSEKTERTGTNISSIKHVTRKLKEVSCFSRAKQQQGNVQKKCAARAKHLVFSISRFFIFFEETINIKESFAFSPN